MSHLKIPYTLFAISYAGVHIIFICCTYKKPLCIQTSHTKDTTLQKLASFVIFH